MLKPKLLTSAILFSLSTLSYAVTVQVAPNNVVTQKQETPEKQNNPNGQTQTNQDAPYQVSVNVNNSNAYDLLTEHLSLITKQNTKNLDSEQIHYLVEQVPAEAEQMLRTIGYFDNTIHVIQKPKDHYQVNVKLGKHIKIDNVILVLKGDVEKDPDLGYYYRDAFLNWRLPLGSYFTEDAWSASKKSAITPLLQKKYPLATITTSEALINVKEGTAVLKVYINSHQPVYFGALNITGEKRYPKSIISGLADFQTGSVYELSKIVGYQQALEQDGHYSNVLVHANFNQFNLKDSQVPIDVNVTEVKLHKLDVGLRYDSVEGAGIRLSYDDYNFFNRGYIGSAVIHANRYEQNIGAGISQPRDRDGYFYTTSANLDNNSVDKTQTLSAGLWRVRLRDNIDSRLGIEHYHERHNGSMMNYLTMLTYSWKRNTIETDLRPSSGYYVSSKVGVTLGSLLSSASMQRVYLNGAYYYTPEKREYGTFIFHGALGYVHTSNSRDVPQNLLFRTGGATSVRAYDNNSIGIKTSDGKVEGGKVLALAGIEYDIPFKHDYAFALFHDMGDVANHFGDLHFKHSTGIGIRWYSPVAPLAFDIGYAHATHKIGWHINLGTRF